MPLKDGSPKVIVRLSRPFAFSPGVFFALLGLVTLLIAPGDVWSALGGRDGVRSFFAQGQAIVHDNDLASTRRNAIQHMQMQAVTQASGVFISPSQMGIRFEEMYHEVFSRPEKFVQNYQVFLEIPSEGGLYKVAGTVTVSLDLLRADFVRRGFMEEDASSASAEAKAPPEGLERSAPQPLVPSEDGGHAPRTGSFEHGEGHWEESERVMASPAEGPEIHSGGRVVEGHSERAAQDMLDVLVEPGVMELRVISPQSYVRWLELEELLRKEAPHFAVSSLELGHGKTIVRITGVEGDVLGPLDGAFVSGERFLKVERLHGEGAIFRVTFEEGILQDPLPSPGEPDHEETEAQ